MYKICPKLSKIAFKRGNFHFSNIFTDFLNLFQASEMRRATVLNTMIKDQGPNRVSSILSLSFKVKKHHVHNARLGTIWVHFILLYFAQNLFTEIRCEASIFNTYRRSELQEIFVKTHEAGNLATAPNHSYASFANKYHLSQLLYIIVLVTALAWKKIWIFSSFNMLCQTLFVRINITV